MPSPRPLRVLLTVDTEVSHSRREDPVRDWARLRDRDILGRTPQGWFGLGHLLERLAAHGLKASFFVEALCALRVGIPELAAITGPIRQAGQEVSLHLHSEWLPWLDLPELEGWRGDNLRDFSQERQERLISLGLKALAQAGAGEVRALRAGNYGADAHTLAAAAAQGLLYDTSYNPCYLDGACGLRQPQVLLGPSRLGGLWEMPIGFLQDYPGHCRHLQLTACSLGELTHALAQAHRQGWGHLVLVLHSFELIQRRHQRGPTPRVDHVMLRRFEGLCAFLEQNRQEMPTCHFGDLDPRELAAPSPTRPLTSHPGRTLWRLGEQGLRRLAARRA